MPYPPGSDRPDVSVGTKKGFDYRLIATPALAFNFAAAAYHRIKVIAYKSPFFSQTRLIIYIER